MKKLELELAIELSDLFYELVKKGFNSQAVLKETFEDVQFRLWLNKQFRDDIKINNDSAKLF